MAAREIMIRALSARTLLQELRSKTNYLSAGILEGLRISLTKPDFVTPALSAGAENLDKVKAFWIA